jgi:hypothetical protein
VRDEPPASEPRFEYEWYGTYTLVADVMSGGLLLMGISGEASMAAGAGFLGYGFGAPLVHVSQGEPLRGLGSLGVRVAAPVVWGGVGWWLGPKSETSTDSDDRSNFAFYCGLAGAASAMIFDSAVLAWKDVPVQPSDGPTFALTPVVDSKRTGVSLSGTF